MLSLPLLSTVQMLGKQITGILEPARGMENTEAIEPVMLMPTLKPGLHFAVQKRLPVWNIETKIAKLFSYSKSWAQWREHYNMQTRIFFQFQIKFQLRKKYI